jgi:predicted  nucleic acid-binding Zn-ribbon protein
MVPSIVGLIASAALLVVAWDRGLKYQRWLPMRETAETLAALKVDLQNTQEELNKAHATWSQAQYDIEEAQRQRDWMEVTRDEVAQLESAKRELDEVGRKLAERRATVDQLATDIVNQKRELLPENEFRARLETQEKLRHELPRLEAQKTQLTREVSELGNALTSLRKELDGLLVSRREVESALHVARSEVQALEVRRDSLEKQIDDLRETKVSIGGPVVDQDDGHRSQLLWVPSIAADDFDAVVPEDTREQDALDGVRNRIAAQGFIYHDRVLKAFHTSLKCADVAPLTVLAGISGTGKSALPTRYARAIGMHLQTVPVQPGWDSPADLLGFYNHLEQRFRPTELMRALIQMDYVHDSAIDGAGGGATGLWPSHAEQRHELSDRVLLVLLDEMNLARVEYYFSEFLSRLELRRGVLESDASERRRSELVLDLGSAASTASSELRVFVGRNVLFVGTMNEDESTQTLSDKVIDRSNIMRFGRPKRLHIEAAAPADQHARRPALSRSLWRRWIQDATFRPGQEERVDGWIATLNEALAKVGRPYAYRVSEAMRTYVRLYPGHSDREVQEAMADQVELRILPRLRGLDLQDRRTSEAMEDVRRVVESELEDGELASAMQAALDHSHDQLFHWSGLDRT